MSDEAHVVEKSGTVDLGPIGQKVTKLHDKRAIFSIKLVFEHLENRFPFCCPLI